jgi:uncharacterized protein with FMN-binding domain
MAKSGSNKKLANSLVAVSSAAVMAVYAAGYTRTRAAAEGFDAETAGRRSPGIPPPARNASPVPGVPAGESIRPAEVAPAADSPQLVASVHPAPAAKLTADTSAPASVVNQPAAPPVGSDGAPPKTETFVATATAAPAPVAAAPAVSPAAPPWKDGKYDAWGTCRHGDIQATVTIEGGKIASAVISECATRYSCDVIDKLPPEVPLKQSENVDNVSGATQSANAFSYAVFYALAKANAAAKAN